MVLDDMMWGFRILEKVQIANYLVGDQDDADFEKICDKPKLVIIGGGWGVS